MKAIIALTAAAALASAQAPTPYGDGRFKCAKPNAAYCAGDSLGTDIIIRCDKDAIGQPGRCGNNLAGQPPLGVGGAYCYQSSPTAGDAACVKNCVVYAPSSTFTLPTALCTPTYTASTSSSSTTKSSSTTSSTDTTCTTSTSHSKPPSTTTKTTTTTTCSSSTSTPYTKPPPVTKTTTKTSDCLSTTTYIDPEPTKYPHHNSTITTKTSSTSYSATTRAPVTTAGAASNQAMGGLAAVGLLAAYLL